jgi:hypothetical protein
LTRIVAAKTGQGGNHAPAAVMVEAIPVRRNWFVMTAKTMTAMGLLIVMTRTARNINIADNGKYHAEQGPGIQVK